MAIPKSVTKVKKNGVEFISSVDKCSYTIRELTFAAMYDVAKFLRKKLREKSRKFGLKGRRVSTVWQYWVRKNEADLQIGTKAKTWYGAEQELGSNKTKEVKSHTRHKKTKEVIVQSYTKRFQMQRYGLLVETVEENLNDVRNIMAQYISAIDSEPKAAAFIGGTNNVTDKQSEKDNS